MRSYRQYCGLARALDVVGDRWTLLIIRELLIRGSSRYTDLRDGLPGIATNLLADRLNELEQAGLIQRSVASAGAALYELTPRGKELEDVIAALGRWAAPLMGRRSRGDAVRGHWLALPVQLYLADGAPNEPPVTLELRATGDSEPVTVEAANGAVRARPGRATLPDLVLAGPPEAIMSVLMGRVEIGAARRAGLQATGEPAVLQRLQRRAPNQ